MRIPEILYDFGISQDDPATELKALGLSPGDRMLCVASAGEVPLELLVNSEESIEIDAVDISGPQLYLANLKLQAAMELEGTKAASFLGYLQADQSERRDWFDRIKGSLPEEEARFWMDNDIVLEKGPIHYGRYETYISRFAPIGRWMLGGKQKILGLFECTEIEQQRAYFDEVLRTRLLKFLFKLMFNQRLYRNRGVSEQGLIHVGEQNVGLRFFLKFRDFCTNTPAKKNWYLQFMLFNRLLFNEALPDYLQTRGQERLKSGYRRLRFINKSFTAMVEESPPGHYNKFVFSNISDWLAGNEIMYLMDLIRGNAGPNASGLVRYIHSSGLNPKALHRSIELDPEYGEQLLQRDRFPFYNLIPFKITGVTRGKKYKQ